MKHFVYAIWRIVTLPISWVRTRLRRPRPTLYRAAHVEDLPEVPKALTVYIAGGPRGGDGRGEVSGEAVVESRPLMVAKRRIGGLRTRPADSCTQTHSYHDAGAGGVLFRRPA